MADDLYLDGSQPYHRHAGDRGVIEGDVHTCVAPTPAVAVRCFDADALAAHDDAIRASQEAGAGDAPTYREGDWTFALLEPTDPGTPLTEARVLAGWRPDGTFCRYVTPERLARAFREHVETWGS